MDQILINPQTNEVSYYKGGTLVNTGAPSDTSWIDQAKAWCEAYRTPEEIAQDVLIDNYVETNDDLTAIDVLIEEWRPDVNYRANMPLKYEGVVYVTIQDHISGSYHLPDQTASLYRLHNRTSEGAEISEWVEPLSTEDAYQYGDKVMYNGEVWVSVHPTANTWTPGVYGWEKEIN